MNIKQKSKSTAVSICPSKRISLQTIFQFMSTVIWTYWDIRMHDDAENSLHIVLLFLKIERETPKRFLILYLNKYHMSSAA